MQQLDVLRAAQAEGPVPLDLQVAVRPVDQVLGREHSHL